MSHTLGKIKKRRLEIEIPCKTLKPRITMLSGLHSPGSYGVLLMLLDVLFPFKWHDLLDILVISFILHRLFLLFRGTTALQIILGLLLLWVIQGIAEAGGLVLTSWFFQGIGAVAVLVIVVVFRNEIREVLFQTNPVRLFFGSTQETRRMSVESIVQAVFQLAKTKTGALIVLQNRDSIEPHLREGFALDARFNPLIATKRRYL